MKKSFMQPDRRKSASSGPGTTCSILDRLEREIALPSRLCRRVACHPCVIMPFEPRSVANMESRVLFDS
jgi:hypothetical protein